MYFRIADHFNIIDKPNERSSHSKVVISGSGILFLAAGVSFINVDDFGHQRVASNGRRSFARMGKQDFGLTIGKHNRVRIRDKK